MIFLSREETDLDTNLGLLRKHRRLVRLYNSWILLIFYFIIKLKVVRVQLVFFFFLSFKTYSRLIIDYSIRA